MQDFGVQYQEGTNSTKQTGSSSELFSTALRGERAQGRPRAPGEPRRPGLPASDPRRHAEALGSLWGPGGIPPADSPQLHGLPPPESPPGPSCLPPRPGPPEGSRGTPTNSLPASAREGGGGDRKCQPKASLTASRPADPQPSESRAGGLHHSPKPAGPSRAGSEQAPSWGPEPRPHILGARRAPGPAKQEAQQRQGSVGRGPGQELGRGQKQTGTGWGGREEPQGASPRPDQNQARL